MATVVQSTILNIPIQRYGRELSKIPLDQVKTTLKDLLQIPVKERTEQTVKAINKIKNHIQRLRRKDPDYKQKRAFITKRVNRYVPRTESTESTDSKDSKDSTSSTSSTGSKGGMRLLESGLDLKTIFPGKTILPDPYPYENKSSDYDEYHDFINHRHPNLIIPLEYDETKHLLTFVYDSLYERQSLYTTKRLTTEEKKRYALEAKKVRTFEIDSPRRPGDPYEYLDEAYYRRKHGEPGDWY